MIYINNKILTSVIEFLVIKNLVIVKCKLSGFFLNYFEWFLGILEETKIVSENRVISCIIINTFFFFLEKRIIINT